jgi:hypothetical protein
MKGGGFLKGTLSAFKTSLGNGSTLQKEKQAMEEKLA